MLETLVLPVIGFSAGFVDAIAGGGGLISLPSLLALGLPPKTALGTNKLIGIATALASTGRYGFARSIYWARVIPMALVAAVGAFMGAYVATLVDSKVLQPIILMGLVIVAIQGISKSHFGMDERPRRILSSGWLLLLGWAAGLYDGFFGPGTGTLLMMGFVALFGQTWLQACAHARFVNACTNCGALLLFTSKGYSEYAYVWTASLASFVGGICGASWSLRKGSKAIRWVFLCVVWLLIAKLAWDVILGFQDF